MKLSSILTLNAIRSICEDESKKAKDIETASTYVWFADVIRRVIVDDPIGDDELMPLSAKEAMEILENAKTTAKTAIANRFDP